jgi:hypothetical protein
MDRVGLAVAFPGDHGNHRAFQYLRQALIEGGSFQVK